MAFAKSSIAKHEIDFFSFVQRPLTVINPKMHNIFSCNFAFLSFCRWGYGDSFVPACDIIDGSNRASSYAFWNVGACKYWFRLQSYSR